MMCLAGTTKPWKYLKIKEEETLMKRMNRMLLSIAGLFLLLSGSALAGNDQAGCQDHPLFTRMPGSWIHSCAQKAVMNALVGKYGIAAAPLKSYGVASLVPVAPNDTGVGKAKNRRVELVKQ
jgi:hypothetical protein